VKTVRGLSAAKRINLAERLVAAYVSYVRGQRGIDRTLQTIRGRKLGKFWLTAADTVLKNFSKRDGSVLKFDEPFDSTRNEANKE
jgi:hypothetical protein